MTKKEKQSIDSIGEIVEIESERLENEIENLGDISHTPPSGQGANRVWDGTRVFDGELPDDE